MIFYYQNIEMHMNSIIGGKIELIELDTSLRMMKNHIPIKKSAFFYIQS